MFITGIVTLFTMLLISGGPTTTAARYPTLRPAMATDRLLIVAPHIDDEVIAAGGYAADAIRNGSEVYVVFLTAGDCSRVSARILSKTLDPTAKNYLNVGRTRIAEAKKVMARLGIAEDHFFILGYPDRGLRKILQKPDDVIRSQSTRELSVPYSDAMSPGNPYSYAHLSNDLRRVVEIADPTIVIAPVSFDVHPDHSAAADLTDGILANMNVHPQRLGYLVHTSRLPRSLVWLPDHSVLPPVRYQDQTWAIYPLTRAGEQEKDGVLLTYKSQRPYVFMLRNAFVRKNELFLVYGSGSNQRSAPATVAR
jgi:LmbE family N-acetylglucosaminyl deacetylase